jgi:hypothetical protein
MQNGYVFTVAPNFFGIFLFSKTMPLMGRFSDAETVDEACADFGKKFAGNFKPLPDHVIPLVKDMMNRRDTVILQEFN